MHENDKSVLVHHILTNKLRMRGQTEEVRLVMKLTSI